MTTMGEQGASECTVPDPAARAQLDALVRERGLKRWAYFFVTGEGRMFPNGVEESSGNVVTPDGRVYAFWTGWDARRRSMIFRVWEEDQPDPCWMRSSEYRRARERVGLDQSSASADVVKGASDGAESVGATRGRPRPRSS